MRTATSLPNAAQVPVEASADWSLDRLSPWWIALAWLASLLGVALILVALVLHSINSARLADAPELFLADIWLAVVTPVVGAYLLSRGGSPLLGLALLSTVLLSVGTAAGMYGTYVTAVEPGRAPFGNLAAWIATWAWGPYLLLLIVVPMLLPGGRVLSRRWGMVALFFVFLIGVITCLAAVAPGQVEAFPHLVNPLGVSSASWLGPATDALIVGTVVAGAPAGLVSVMVRWHRKLPGQHQPSWILASIALLVASVLLAGLFPYPWSDLVPAIGFTTVLAAILWSSHCSLEAQEREARDAIRDEERRAERARFGRDLHDSVGPEIAGLSLQLNAISALMAEHPARSQLSAAEQSLRRTAGELRSLIQAGNPVSFPSGSLTSALKERAATLSCAGNATMLVRSDKLPSFIPHKVEIAAYRIASEGMTNVVRHARASECIVSLRVDDRRLIIEIADDGQGGNIQPTGVGLDSMRRRVEEMDGDLTIGTAASGRGTLVRAMLPLGDASCR